MLRNKRGNEMIEASIVYPVIILVTVLLLRLFTFYLEILCTGVRMHEEALEAMDSFEKPVMQVYNRTEEVTMLTGGLLTFDPSHEIRVRAYFLNEDGLVRAKEVLHEE